MLDQNTFTETLKEVAEILRISATVMSREDILSYFKDMELTPEQENMVLTYLLTPHDEPVSSEEKTEAIENQDQAQDQDPETKEASEELSPSELLAAWAKESPVFAMYLEDVNQLPPMSAKASDALYRALSEGDESTITPLMNGWLPQVLVVAHSFLNQNVNPEDLIQEGNMSLFMKLRELCGSGLDIMEIQLSILPAIKEGMTAYISQMTGEENHEETIAAKANMLEQARKTLMDETGEEPTLSALAQYTHMSEEELSDLSGMMNRARDLAAKKSEMKS